MLAQVSITADEYFDLLQGICVGNIYASGKFAKPGCQEAHTNNRAAILLGEGFASTCECLHSAYEGRTKCLQSIDGVIRWHLRYDIGIA
jgi:hypothetical protein